MSGPWFNKLPDDIDPELLQNSGQYTGSANQWLLNGEWHPPYVPRSYSYPEVAERQNVKWPMEVKPPTNDQGDKQTKK